jgi:hypothetical protein
MEKTVPEVRSTGPKHTQDGVADFMKMNVQNNGVEQTPRKLCLKWKASGGAAHAGHSQGALARALGMRSWAPLSRLVSALARLGNQPLERKPPCGRLRPRWHSGPQ